MFFHYRKTTANILAVLVFCVAPIYADAGSESNENTSWHLANGQYVQRLSWQSDPNVLRYVVRIENEDKSAAVQYETQSDFIDVSLPPGPYIYTVYVYNQLDILEYNMPPVNFDVLPALQPEVTRWTRKTLSGGGEFEVTITGRNIISDSRVYLSSESGVANPLRFEVSGNTARALFPPSAAGNDAWILNVENPGGLRTQATDRTAMHLDLSGVYGPFVPIKGNTTFESMLPDSAYFASAGAKLAWMPFRYKTFGFGVAIEPFWTGFKSTLSISEIQYETVDSQLWGVNAVIIAGNKFFETLSLNLTLGAGAAVISGVSFQHSNEQIEAFTTLVYAVLGASLKFYPKKWLFIEAGASFCTSFPLDSPGLIYIRPQIGIGVSL